MKYLKLLTENINTIGCSVFLLSGIIGTIMYFAGGQIDRYLSVSSQIDFAIALIFSILMKGDKKC